MIQIDTREKPQAIAGIKAFFDKHNIEYIDKNGKELSWMR